MSALPLLMKEKGGTKMISADLLHNPFLLETEVLFNGRAPQMNSAVHKYDKRPFVDWVNEVPRILHDEMNGYGFDLLFTGTDLDFKLLKNAFQAAGVPEESVRVIRKGGLGAADEKMALVSQLVDWLRNNPNERLDFAKFSEKNPDLLDVSFPLIVLHGEPMREPFPMVSVETANDAKSLDGSDLTNTPILVFITRETAEGAYDDVEHLLARKDVCCAQLFFAIHPQLNEERVIRVLSDLGVERPQVVTAADDLAVTEYIKSHPVAEYVRNSICLLSAEAERIGAELRDAGKGVERSSARGEEEIGEYESEIALLKESDDRLANYSLPSAPRAFGESVNGLCELLSRWKVRKRRVEGETEAAVAADDLNRTVEQAIAALIKELDEAMEEARDRIDRELADAYTAAGIDAEYRHSVTRSAAHAQPDVPNIREELMLMSVVELVERKGDLFGFFAGKADEPEVEPATVFYMDAWRARVLDMVKPIVESLTSDRVHTLQSYHAEAVDDYRAHIASLVADRIAKKEEMFSRLSDAEKALQAENDWHAIFNDMLQTIKRG